MRLVRRSLTPMGVDRQALQMQHARCVQVQPKHRSCEVQGVSESEIGAPGPKTEVGQALRLWVLKPSLSSKIADEYILPDHLRTICDRMPRDATISRAGCF